MQVLGRWLLYSLAGLLLAVMLFGGGGDGFGNEDPKKGRWRSIILSIAGSVTGAAGALLYYADRMGGEAAWPAAGLIAWLVAGCFVIGAWCSIAADIRREAGEPTP